MSERGQPGWVPEDDPVIALLLSGESMTLHEAEELYLDRSLPLVLELLRGTMNDEELGRHPLMKMLVAHGSRGREDTL
jgi:hypothetical protein